ncbi:MAG: ferrous iron transport protein A [Clostridia bacterium]|nr:ferrous iron transport protein A [Clostridia bacterium]
MTLISAEEGREYTVRAVDTGDEEMDSFLFSLGCYPGEPITVVSHLKGSCVVSIKDGRYTIDRALADTVAVG